MSSSYEQAIGVVFRNMPECDDHEVTRDEAKDIVDALYSGGFFSVAVRPVVGDCTEDARPSWVESETEHSTPPDWLRDAQSRARRRIASLPKWARPRVSR